MAKRIKSYSLSFTEKEMILISDGISALRRHLKKIKLLESTQEFLDNIQRKLYEAMKING